MVNWILDVPPIQSCVPLPKGDLYSKGLENSLIIGKPNVNDICAFIPLDTGRKLNLRKTFNLHPVPRGIVKTEFFLEDHFFHAFVISDVKHIPTWKKVGKIYWDKRIILFLKEATLCHKLCFNILENFCERQRQFRCSRPEVFCKKCLLKNCAKSTRNTCGRVSFLKKLQT